MARTRLTLLLRPHQLAAYRSETRFEVRVWHRRAGKTFYTIGRMLTRALQTNRRDWRAYYLCPTRVQAKAIAWDYLKKWVSRIPGVEINESELRVDLPNGARIQLLGAESYDSLRGRYADDITLDETAHIPSTAWTQVLSPMLTDRKGRATFIGTPNGRMNLFYDLWEYAGGSDPDWSRSLLTYQDTNVLDLDEIRRQRSLMREEEFEQEFNCSWDAALRGAYYSKEMARADRDGRITTVAFDRTLPVVMAVDLGWSDGMACTAWQVAGTQHRAIWANEYHFTSIPEVVEHWRTLPFPITEAILPHDARVHDLGTGATRQEVFHSMGVTTSIAPKMGVHEGIEQVRQLLEHAWFDREATQYMREAIAAYRSTFDEVKGVHSVKPLHNWACHMADSVRYYATGRPSARISTIAAPRPRLAGVM